jgi:hypothetical protein
MGMDESPGRGNFSRCFGIVGLLVFTKGVNKPLYVHSVLIAVWREQRNFVAERSLHVECLVSS